MEKDFMTELVIPAKAGIQRKHYWIPAFAGMTAVIVLLASCAHRGDLKSPAQAKIAEEKAAAKEAKKAKEKKPAVETETK